MISLKERANFTYLCTDMWGKNFDKFKWLWNMSKGMRSIMLMNFLAGSLHVFVSLTFVWLCKHIVDIATHVTQGDLKLYVTLMLSAMACSILFSALESWLRGQNSIRANNSLRSRVFHAVMCSKWTGTDRFHSGDTMNRLQEDIRVIGQAISTDIPDFFLTLVQLGAASTFLFVLDARLLWVILILMPLAVLASKFFYKKMKELTKKVRAQESAVQGMMQENLQHRLLVLTLCRMDETFSKLEHLQQELYGIFRSRLYYSVRARMLLQFGFSGGYCAAFLWGIWGIQAGTVTFGMMTAFLQLVAQVQRPIVSLTHYIPTFITLVTSCERLQELTELPQEDIEQEEALDGPLGLRIQNLSFHYPDSAKNVVEMFSHDFKPGSTTAIIGETGAGKSTVARLLLQLLEPQEGDITLYNQENGETPMAASRRNNFMYVPQGNSLMSGTVRENLLMGNPQATEEEMHEVLQRVCADFVFERPEGLDLPCGEKGGGLSEGQAQRIAIARALLHSGNILILDEASSALDPQTEREILETLVHIQDKTIIWITHHEAVAKYLDNTVEIKTR